jgi:ATP-dependent Lon protease
MPGGGMPGGMPGFPGGSPGGEDEDGDVPQLERRVKAAALPAEAEEVAQRELKRLRRMSPMHSEYASR